MANMILASTAALLISGAAMFSGFNAKPACPDCCCGDACACEVCNCGCNAGCDCNGACDCCNK